MKGVCSNSSLIQQMTLRGVFYGFDSINLNFAEDYS